MISRTKLPPPAPAENIKKFCTLNQASFVSNVSIVSNVSLASLAWPFFFACSVDFPLISATRQSLTFQRDQRVVGESGGGGGEGEAGSALTDVKHTGEPLAGAQGVCSGGWVFLFTPSYYAPSHPHMLIHTFTPPPLPHTHTHTQRRRHCCSHVDVVDFSHFSLFHASSSFTFSLLLCFRDLLFPSLSLSCTLPFCLLNARE